MRVWKNKKFLKYFKVVLEKVKKKKEFEKIKISEIFQSCAGTRRLPIGWAAAWRHSSHCPIRARDDRSADRYRPRIRPRHFTWLWGKYFWSNYTFSCILLKYKIVYLKYSMVIQRIRPRHSTWLWGKYFWSNYIFSYIVLKRSFVSICFYITKKAFRHVETLYVQGNQVRTNQNKPPFLLAKKEVCVDQYELDYLGRIKFLHVEIPYWSLK